MAHMAMPTVTGGYPRPNSIQANRQGHITSPSIMLGSSSPAVSRMKHPVVVHFVPIRSATTPKINLPAVRKIPNRDRHLATISVP